MSVKVIDKYNMSLHLLATLFRACMLFVALYGWIRYSAGLRDVIAAAEEVGFWEFATMAQLSYIAIFIAIIAGIVLLVMYRSEGYKLHKTWLGSDLVLFAGDKHGTYILGNKSRYVKFSASSVLTDEVDKLTVVIGQTGVTVYAPAPPALW